MLEALIGVLAMFAAGVLAFYAVGLKVRRMALDDGEHRDTAVFAAVALAAPAGIVAACLTALAWSWGF